MALFLSQLIVTFHFVESLHSEISKLSRFSQFQTISAFWSSFLQKLISKDLVRVLDPSDIFMDSFLILTILFSRTPKIQNFPKV